MLEAQVSQHLVVREKLFLDPVILYQQSRFQKFMFEYKLSIPSRNLCQVVLDVFVT